MGCGRLEVGGGRVRLRMPNVVCVANVVVLMNDPEEYYHGYFPEEGPVCDILGCSR